MLNMSEILQMEACTVPAWKFEMSSIWRSPKTESSLPGLNLEWHLNSQASVDPPLILLHCVLQPIHGCQSSIELLRIHLADFLVQSAIKNLSTEQRIQRPYSPKMWPSFWTSFPTEIHHLPLEAVSPSSLAPWPEAESREQRPRNARNASLPCLRDIEASFRQRSQRQRVRKC